MATTPPPPRRIHTPPTPLHGPKYDTYEPYSPRRSSRVAARAVKDTPSPRFSSSPLKQTVRASTPPSTAKSHRTCSSSHTLSPPLSPNSPTRRVSLMSQKKRGQNPKTSKTYQPPDSGSDTDILPGKDVHRRTVSSQDSFGMFHTPAKTPKRRKDANFDSAARLMFGDNEGLLQPTPRRQKKSAFDAFDILADDQQDESSKIEIFTDMKERLPTADEDDNNPFLTRNAAKPSTRSKGRKRGSRSAKEAAKDDEGMTYVFRGRKVFRKFEDPDSNDANDDDDLSDLDLKRKAGTAGTKPLLRSSIKPRLLFPSEVQQQERDEADEAADDEEALTEIDEPKPFAVNASTPKRVSRAVTPPTTVKGRRLKNVATTEEVQPQNELQAEEARPQPQKKRSLFDSYPRKKAGSAAKKSTKREGSPMELTQAPKRTRSGAHS